MVPMDKQNYSVQLSADKPETDPAKDLFGYAPFAKHLANAIVTAPAPERLVIAITGEWGLGKSTVLEYILRAFEEEAHERDPVVIRFNPWWFAGQDDLI